MSDRPVHSFEFVFIGVASVVAQTVFLRRLIGLFGGSEVQYALMLTIWLFEAGLWSLFAQRLVNRSQLARQAAIPIINVSLSLLYPFYLLLPTLESQLFSPLLGTPILLSGLFAIFALVVPTAYAGAAFALLCARLGGSAAKHGLSRAYFLDTIGFAFGGLLITAALSAAGADPVLLIILGIVGLGLCLVGISGRRTMWLILTPIGVGAVLLVYIARTYVLDPPALEFADGSSYFVKMTESDSRWSVSALSPYGRIDVMSDRLSVDLYFNSRLASSYPGADAGELIVLPLAMTANPRRLAILGGALDGKAAFAIHDTALEVCQVEPDPVIRSLFQRVFGGSTDDQLVSRRSSLVAEDPVDFVTEVQPGLDVIFINYTDPSSISQGNLFTREFFELARTKLAIGGVLAFPVRCGENFIQPERLDYISSLALTLGAVFPKVAVLPGEIAMMVGGMSESSVTVNPDSILNGAHAFKEHRSYYGPAYLSDMLSQWRVEKLRDELAAHSGAVLTTTSPQSFLLNSMLEMDRFQGIDSKILRFLRGMPTYSAIVLCILPMVLFSIASIQSKRAVAHLPAFYAGLLGLSTNILLIAAYQSVAGSLFSMIGLVNGLFMTGIAVGASLGERVKRCAGSASALSGAIALAAVCSLLLGLSLPHWLGDFRSRQSAEVIILLSSVLSGVFPGLIFGIVSAQSAIRQGCQTAGSLYGLDLLGSAVGGIVATLVLLPLIGIARGFLVISISGFVAAAATMAGALVRKQT